MTRNTQSNEQPAGLDTTRSRERLLWEAGRHVVAGVDEAGVGPLAGPVVAAAVVLGPDFDATGVDDSKKLSATQRERAFARIIAESRAWSIARCTPEEIDDINIYHASLLAMQRALDGLGVALDHVLVDGRRLPHLLCEQTRIVGGDAIEVAIAAASILAKVNRDRLMAELDAQYPGYGFAQHKGYPTAAHVKALRTLGPTKVHRLSYPAVQRIAFPQGPLLADASTRTLTAAEWRDTLRR